MQINVWLLLKMLKQFDFETIQTYHCYTYNSVRRNPDCGTLNPYSLLLREYTTASTRFRY